EGRVVDGGTARLRFEAGAAREALLAEPGALLERSDTEVRMITDALALRWLAGLAGQEDDVAGRLRADVRLTGARPAPRATGFARIEDAELPLEVLGGPLGPIAIDVALEGDALRLERLHVAGSEGEVRGSGRVAWSVAERAPADTDLRIVFDRFSLPAGGTVSGRLIGELALTGTWPALRLGGRVAMDPGRFRAPPARDPTWEEIRIHGLEDETPAPRREPGDPGPALPDAFARSAANLAVVIEPGSRFTGQGADLRLTGEIRLLKEPGGQPLFVGSIRTTEGFYAFRGRRFTVQRGAATLAGTRELDPELDVVATQRIGEVE